MYQSCHFFLYQFCHNSWLHVSILSLPLYLYQFCHCSCICINSVIVPVSILSLFLYQFCHCSCINSVCINSVSINSVIVPVSILSLFLYQFCHCSCINSVIVPVSLYQSCHNSCINPHCLFLKATVTFKLKHSYPPAGIHFHVGLTWMLDLNLSAAACDLPFVIVLAAIPIGCYWR